MTTTAEEILRLQIEEDPDFLAKREVLYQAMLDAQAKMRICAEPEFSILKENLRSAQSAFAQQGAKWAHHVMCGQALQAAALSTANLQARHDLKSERHREVNKEAMRKAKDKPKAQNG